MSTLLQDILYPGIVFEQDFKIQRRTNLAHIRVSIYVQNVLVDGDLQMEVFQGANLLSTTIITFTDINAAMTDTFNWGYLRFDFDSLSLGVDDGNIEQEYTVKVQMINHTKDTANFLAVNRQWENPLYDRYGEVDGNGDPINDAINPLGIELYEWRRA